MDHQGLLQEIHHSPPDKGHHPEYLSLCINEGTVKEITKHAINCDSHQNAGLKWRIL